MSTVINELSTGKKGKFDNFYAICFKKEGGGSVLDRIYKINRICFVAV